MVSKSQEMIARGILTSVTGLFYSKMRRPSLKDVCAHVQRLTVEMLSERKHSAILNDLDRFHEVCIPYTITCSVTLHSTKRISLQKPSMPRPSLH